MCIFSENDDYNVTKNSTLLKSQTIYARIQKKVYQEEKCLPG